MLKFDEIDKLATTMEATFREENEGRHITLNTRLNTGLVRFEFDIHVQEFRLTTDRSDNLSLLIYIVCKNGKFGYDEDECNNLMNIVHELPEDPILEYYEKLNDDQPGRFTFSNLDQIILNRAYCAVNERGRRAEDRDQVKRAFTKFENQLNEDSVYNVNLSKIIFAEEFEATKKENELAEIAAAEAERIAAKKAARQEKLDNVGNVAKAVGIGTAALVAAPIVIPAAPIILLSSALGYFAGQLLEDSF